MQYYNDLFGSLLGEEVVTLHMFLGRPKSRGWVKLRSSNPYDAPRINHKFLEDPEDMEMMLKGILIAPFI